MDAPGLAADEHRAALAGLARLNAWSAADRALFEPIKQLAHELGRPVRLLDLACGGGDQIVRLARRARRAGFELRPAGCDSSPLALEVAADRARSAGVEACFFQNDVVQHGLPQGFDVIICSLYVHQLSEDDAAELFSAIEEASPRLAVIQDLRRGRRGAVLAAFASRVLTRSSVVRSDALRSVRSAFDMDEVERLARRAGMFRSRLRRVWPLRWQLEWRPRPRDYESSDEIQIVPQAPRAAAERPAQGRVGAPSDTVARFEGATPPA